MASWRVDPASFPFSLVNGAGQFRAIGNTVGLQYRQVIKDKISAAYDTLEDINSTTYLSTLYSQVTEKDSDQTSPLRVVIVSSLAGGTGAGLLLTVSDIIRAMGKEAYDDVFGILYTPDVFGSHGNYAGTSPNSLAAISELLNGNWYTGRASSAPDDERDDFGTKSKQPESLNSIGLPSPISMTGPRMPFLVGLTNSEGINHGSKDALFEIVGRALMTWAADETVQRNFIAYTIGNWRQSQLENSQKDAALLAASSIETEIGLPCLSSLGFARLSMGTDYFREYAARRLVRECVEHLVSFHTNSGEARAAATRIGIQDGEMLAKEIAKDHWRTLLLRYGLNERGPDNNQIQDAFIEYFYWIF